ncbi:MAG: surface lipoprotein assembly modifier, partial [Pseudomonadota bacterium]|nr:surface lipoprotein assembly modifier [Pseudomonadota bacterium]
QYISLNPSYTLIHGKNEFNFRAQWMDRDYDQEKDRDREGERVLFGFDYTRDINANLALKAGATTYTQDGREDYEEFDVDEVYASGLWNAWEGGAVFLRVSYRETEYDGLEPIFNIGRDEDETRYILGVSHNFRGGTMEGWGISGRISYSDNESNIDIFEYDRNLASLELTKRF